jgi:hypothetical protein
MEEWIDTSEASQLSNLPVETIRVLIRRYQVAAHKRGGRFWISKQSLLQYLASDRQAATILDTPNASPDAVPSMQTTDTLSPQAPGIDFAAAYEVLIHAYIRLRMTETHTTHADERPTS